MVEIQILPAVEPEKQLTAKSKIKSLNEHQLAFLNQFNAAGFINEPDYVLSEDKISDILIKMVLCDFTTLNEICRLAWRISNLSNKVIKTHIARDLLAKAPGYGNYKLLQHRRDLPIQNVLEGLDKQKEIFYEDRKGYGISGKVHDQRIKFAEWLATDAVPVNEFEETLIDLKTREMISDKQARTIAFELKRMAPVKYNLSLCYDLVVMCFGYSCWPEALTFKRDDVFHRRHKVE